MNTNSFGQRAAAPEKNTTRLVSIVSKPIKVGVVVVVIVVVFVKKSKNLIQKQSMSKNL